MATQLARPHTHLSNRARVRAALERKPVFKSVLESPFQLSWPSVPTNVQNAVLARLVAALENVPPRARASRKFLHTPRGRTNGDITEEVDHASDHPNPSLALDQAWDTISGVSSRLVIGINAVTRALEHQLRLTRKHVVVDNPSQNGDQLSPCPSLDPIVVVFVCCADVDPTALIEHLLYLVAGCNSPRNVTQPIKLVPLPKGSELVISQTLGVRRAAVIACRLGSPLFETFQDILDPVPIVSAPWLCPSNTLPISQLVPTHIKQLRTTAPKDMKGARKQRAQARAVAKKNTLHSSRSSRRKPRVTLTTRSESAAQNGQES